MKRHRALVLVLLLAVLYTILGNGRIQRGDGETMFQVTRAMAETGGVDLPAGILPPAQNDNPSSTDTELAFLVVGREGRTYSKYGLGQSLAALPLYGLGMAWRALTGDDYAPRFAASLLNGLLTACTAGLLLLLACEMGCSGRAGSALVLVYALCTPAWPYTHTSFSEPLVTLCLVAAALFALRFKREAQDRWLALAGGALGLALFTRINALAALPAFVLYLILTWQAQRPSHPRLLRQVAVFSLTLGLGVGLALLYNQVRFQSPFDFGYHSGNWQTPFLVGLYGLTLSPGKGLLWYAPPVWLGLLGARTFVRQHLHEAVLCAGVTLGYLLFHSPYTYWEGGWCWGPRLLLPALPFALLPAGPVLTRPHLRQSARLALAGILVLGFLVQLPAVGADYERTLQVAHTALAEDFYMQVMFQPAHSALLHQWLSLLEVTANLRNPAARAHLANMLAQVQPGEAVAFSHSPAEALHWARRSLLAFNLPDLWLVAEPIIRREAAP
jgi:4-amino-4-deoxy-L-arabinose transferase-like glycosyltransferase